MKSRPSLFQCVYTYYQQHPRIDGQQDIADAEGGMLRFRLLAIDLFRLFLL